MVLPHRDAANLLVPLHERFQPLLLLCRVQVGAVKATLVQAVRAHSTAGLHGSGPATRFHAVDLTPKCSLALIIIVAQATGA